MLKIKNQKVYLTAGLLAVFAIFGAFGYGIIHNNLNKTSPSSKAAAIAPGAKLPISYDLNAISQAKIFVDDTGNDSTGNGSVGSPYKTLAKAISTAATNSYIIVRGGTYREGNLSIPSSKTLTIKAYPGEIPVFNGAQAFASGWSAEGSYSYHAYTPKPVTDGSGISFSTGQNLNGDGVGKYPDQAWVGSTQLQQVSAKASLAAGKFFVDTANNRIYLMSNNVSQGSVEASDKNVFLDINSPSTTIEGIKIVRYSNGGADYGVVKVKDTADNSVIRNVEISDSAFIALSYLYSYNLLTGCTLEDVTVTKSNWMGVAAMLTDNLTLNRVLITDMNQFNEFTHSPQSGAFKTSRTRYTKVLNSEISNNNSHGLWFDQSNIDVDVANNIITDNAGSGLFFEISDDLLLINNYIKSTGGARAVKLAGSSGLKLVNNTIIGGADPIGVYVDGRSIAGCADPSKPLCATSYSSDRDSVRAYDPKLDWMSRIDLMINNIIAYPSAAGYCGATTALCVTSANGSASAPIQTVIHQADASRGIPKTYINGNVYANGSGKIAITGVGSYTTVASFAQAMAGSPVNISSLESLGKEGNAWVNSDGSQTSQLNSVNNQAYAIPTDSNINQYITAGTKYYGYMGDGGSSQPSGDTIDPSVTITSPTSGSIVSGSNVTLSANASDNVGVTKVELKVNSSIICSDTSAPYSCGWNSTLVPDGSYTVNIVAYDAASNTATASAPITVKNTQVTNNSDLNSDAKVNIQDLSILLSKWGTNSQPADINKDGTVNIQDLSILLSKWTG